MELTKVTDTVLDIPTLSVALNNDSINGGIKDFVDHNNHYYTNLNIIQQIATTGGAGTSLVFDASGNLYWAVTNYYNGTTWNLTNYVYKITPDGKMTTFASQATNGSLSTSLVFDTSGNLYWAVMNSYNGTTYNLTSYVYKITPAGTKTTFASAATNCGNGASLVFDTSGNLYWAVMNYYNGTTYNITSYVYKITPAGTLSTFTSQATSASTKTSLIFDTSGNLYWAVMNYYNGTTYNITSYVYKITSAGTLSTFTSQATNGAVGTDLVFDTSGNLYWAVSNAYNGTTRNIISYIYKIIPAGTKTTFVSQASNGGYDTSLTFDTFGNLYWTFPNNSNDTTGNLISYIYKITSVGIKIVFASQATTGGYGTSLIFDTFSNLYWAITNFTNNSAYKTTTSIGVLIKQIGV